MNTRKVFVCGFLAVVIALAFTACEDITKLTKSDLTGNVSLSNHSPKVGDSITAAYSPGNGTGTQTWQWFRVGAGTEEFIQGATTSVYTVTDADAGKRIKVQLSYADQIGGLSVTTANTVAPAVPSGDITYTVTQTGGTDGTADTTGIVFTFSESVDSLNLTAADITVGGAAAKGTDALSGTGATRTLAITVSAAGTATVTITKTSIEVGTKDVAVYKAGETGESVTGLANKLAWLQTDAQSNSSYSLEVDADESMEPQTLFYTGKSNITLTLKGIGTNRTVSLSSNGSLFSVGSGVTLVLDNNITLRGRSDNTDSLVFVSGGTLIMNDESTITGNTATYHGGGVSVENGTFTMNGGEISGNTAQQAGGGVMVQTSGTFTMKGGEITGNTATYHSGGGVAVASLGTFTMEGGTISGNTTSFGDLEHGGGGVYVENGTFTMNGGEISGNDGGGVYVYYGTFTMNDGDISGNTAQQTGGGVYVRRMGSFSKSGGTIYGNDAGVLNNTSGSGFGHTVYWESLLSLDITLGASDNINIIGIDIGWLDAVSLATDDWTDYIRQGDGVQWFKFTATANTQYIHASFGSTVIEQYAPPHMYTQVYDSGGNTVGGKEEINSSNRYISRTVTAGQEYYIRVLPYYQNSDTYRIAFSTTAFPPGATTTTLTAGTWADGNIPPWGEQWFTFTATANIHYLYVNLGTLTSLEIRVYDSGFNPIDRLSIGGSGTIPQTVAAGQEYYVRVTGSYGGTYRIAFNASNIGFIQ